MDGGNRALHPKNDHDPGDSVVPATDEVLGVEAELAGLANL